MSLTKKDYESIAGAIYSNTNTDHDHVRYLIDSLCARFKRDNPRFDAERFAAACRTGKHARDLDGDVYVRNDA